MTRSPKAPSSTRKRNARRAAVVTKAQQSERTREALLSRCLRLFAARGFSNTSVDEIATAAGVTKGAIYWHFASKDEILHAILARIREEWRALVHAPVLSQSGPEAQLARLFDAYAELFQKSPEICLFLQQVVLDRKNRAAADQVADVFGATARFIATIIEDGQAIGVMRADVDAITTAHTVIGMLAGASQQAIANSSRTLAQLIAEAKEMTLAHLAKPRGSKARRIAIRSKPHEA